MPSSRRMNCETSRRKISLPPKKSGTVSSVTQQGRISLRSWYEAVQFRQDDQLRLVEHDELGLAMSDQGDEVEIGKVSQ